MDRARSARPPAARRVHVWPRRSAAAARTCRSLAGRRRGARAGLGPRGAAARRPRGRPTGSTRSNRGSRSASSCRKGASWRPQRRRQVSGNMRGRGGGSAQRGASSACGGPAGVRSALAASSDPEAQRSAGSSPTKVSTSAAKSADARSPASTTSSWLRGPVAIPAAGFVMHDGGDLHPGGPRGKGLVNRAHPDGARPQPAQPADLGSRLVAPGPRARRRSPHGGGRLHGSRPPRAAHPA